MSYKYLSAKEAEKYLFGPLTKVNVAPLLKRAFSGVKAGIFGSHLRE
jgi:hypothetical protein